LLGWERTCQGRIDSYRNNELPVTSPQDRNTKCSTSVLVVDALMKSGGMLQYRAGALMPKCSPSEMLQYRTAAFLVMPLLGQQAS
jgi:hypothetical protein